jgi:hypothetical protein
MSLAAGALLFTPACSGPALASASSESRCAQCAVLAESDTPFSELQSHDDSLFVLDARGAIAALPKAGGDLNGLVPHGSGATHFGVTATALAWVAVDDPSGSQRNRIHALGRDGSAGPVFDAYQGAAALAVGLGDAFAGAFSGDTTGSELVRYSLGDGTTSLPAETLSDEEQTELPSAAGSDAEAVWCRSHANSTSSLWRLAASGEPTKTDYPFSCEGLWVTADGRTFVRDSSLGINCYYVIDAVGDSRLLTCTSDDYEQFVSLSDGSAAFIDQFASVRRVATDGQVSLLFNAESLVGIQSDGDQLYYATVIHVGRFGVPAARQMSD